MCALKLLKFTNSRKWLYNADDTRHIKCGSNVTLTDGAGTKLLFLRRNTKMHLQEYHIPLVDLSLLK